MTAPLAVIILAAGMGTRMRSALPKVMHPVAGRPMVAHLLDTVSTLNPQRVVVVAGPDMECVRQTVAPHPVVEQTDRLGTAHAVLQAKDALADFTGDVLVLYGDTPLIRRETLDTMRAARHSAADPAVVVLGFEPDDPAQYGRLVLDSDGGLNAIVEWKEATEAQRAIRLCNSGVMAFDSRTLWSLLAQVKNDNSKGEYYLTDMVALARAAGRTAQVVLGDEAEMLGVNCRRELAQAEAIIQTQLRNAAMDNGATLTAPETVFFAWDTVLGRDVVVGPHVVFGPGVTIGDNVEIKGFCHFEGCTVADNAILGPYARLRPDAVVEAGVHIGNFVEIKKSTIRTGAKVNHLTYVGDADIGSNANIGAGTITCNYDGFGKYSTVVGAGAFIGSNSSLVAPVMIGDGAIVGAGSVVTHDVPADALAVARGKQNSINGWAARFRRDRQKG